MVEETIKSRPLPQSQWPHQRDLLLPRGCNYVYQHTLEDPDNLNHCIEYYLPVGEKTNKELLAKTLLFDQLTNEPAFDTLRTQEQLGYVVFSGSRSLSTTMGYFVRIQSERDNDYLESRIDSFLTNFGKTLRDMDDKEFQDHKRSVINKRLEKLKNLGLETRRLWSHIGSEYFDFLQHEEDAENVRSIDKASMIEYYEKYILPTSPTRSKISVHMIAKAKSQDGGEKKPLPEHRNIPTYITDVTDFKARNPMTASPHPVIDLGYFEDLGSKL
ncbi:Insulinase (Peptidase M16) [Ascosphaera atra]|nr:Insulinase (Peptidase M16) [Ascosphaera atra]